jgi:small GTP-binding protein
MKLSGVPSGFKVVVLGNSGAGKTSILQYALRGMPKMGLQNTIGCECHSITVNLPVDKSVSLKIWDTAGQEIYKSIVPVYVRDAAAALLVYDVTDMTSFSSLDYWHALLMEEQQSESILIYIVANKMDLKDQAAVPEGQARNFADERRGRFACVSALDGTGIKELFEIIADDCLQGRRETKLNIVDPVGPRNGGGGGCC